jgi:hypothetical protein
VTRRHFDPMRGPQGALIVDSVADAVEKIVRYDAVLGGVSRIDLQMSVAGLPHEKLMRAIELLGTRVAPGVRERLAAKLETTADASV